MSRLGFVVTFLVVGGEQSGVHRIRNWAEDLSRDVTRNRWGTVDDPDASTDKVWVIASSSRMLGSLASAIKRTLRHHKLLEDAIVRRLTNDSDWQEHAAFLSQRNDDG